MKRILIITEANEKVASGHLMECIELADVLKEAGYQITFLINDDMPATFQSRISFPYVMYPCDLFLGREAIRDILCGQNIDMAVFNFRRIEDEMLCYIRKEYYGKILCIDELGHRHLSCDVIVNPMIDSYYHEYVDLNAILYAGAKYLVLPRRITEFHERKKEIREKIQRVCVSMGGVDPFGTTLKLAEWLPSLLPEVRIDMVLGGGFQYEEELKLLVCESEMISVHKNIDYIYELFFGADLAFCAGGNTLHELACIGTPTIVIPSMPHEVRNGKAFESFGFGLCLPPSNDLGGEELKKSLCRLIPFQERQSIMKHGKKICTGNGYELIGSLIGQIITL